MATKPKQSSDLAIRARENTDWKCFVCNQEVNQFYARYPISDPKTRSHAPAFFIGLCKSCSASLTFNPAGDVIKRKDKNE